MLNCALPIISHHAQRDARAIINHHSIGPRAEGARKMEANRASTFAASTFTLAAAAAVIFTGFEPEANLNSALFVLSRFACVV